MTGPAGCASSHATVGFRRLVERAHDKIRQASRGMPAVMIRQLDALAKMMVYTTETQREVLMEQAEMILRAERRIGAGGGGSRRCAPTL